MARIAGCTFYKSCKKYFWSDFDIFVIKIWWKKRISFDKSEVTTNLFRCYMTFSWHLHSYDCLQCRQIKFSRYFFYFHVQRYNFCKNLIFFVYLVKLTFYNSVSISRTLAVVNWSLLHAVAIWRSKQKFGPGWIKVGIEFTGIHPSVLVDISIFVYSKEKKKKTLETNCLHISLD